MGESKSKLAKRDETRLSVLSGHNCYAHVTAMRCDGVNPGL